MRVDMVHPLPPEEIEELVQQFAQLESIIDGGHLLHASPADIARVLVMRREIKIELENMGLSHLVREVAYA